MAGPNNKSKAGNPPTPKAVERGVKIDLGAAAKGAGVANANGASYRQPVQITALNKLVLKDLAGRVDRGESIDRISPADMPHARRLLQAGALASRGGKLVVTAEGRAALG